MLSFSTYYYYYHTSLLQSLDKTLIFWGIVRCMSWSVKNLSLVSRWRASWHFFIIWFPVRWCWPTKFPPYLDSSVYLCSPSWAEHQNIHELHDFLQNYARHKTTSPSKLWSNAQNDKPVCVLLFTRASRYKHTLYNVLIPCLTPPLSLSSPSFFHLAPTHQNKKQQQHLLNKHVNWLIKFLCLIFPITNTHCLYIYIYICI
jgi:hypothetical protein